MNGTRTTITGYERHYASANAQARQCAFEGVLEVMSHLQPNSDNTAPVKQANPRRRLLLGGLSLAALGAGGLTSWLSTQPSSAPDLSALWRSEFQQPSGTPLDWSIHRGHPLIINFWATWCTPCVEEMPLIDLFYRQNVAKGWQVVGLAIDQPSRVRSFLEHHPVSYPVGLAGLGGTELSQALGNELGALPFSLVLSAEERVLFKKVGKLKAEELTSLAV